eukprot:TRINITY_DN40624_c0_g1_i1.p1 TRINITY_DN40624_c0_g1~~TRINITY_DN40624_c0_g1_i1.p1  ORF type:complete len:646 (+),score=85.38 TRINITY_DN40624_c0_g1_i1:55-1992(+)
MSGVFIFVFSLFSGVSALANVRQAGPEIIGQALNGPSRPHIVFVLASDLGFHDVGYRNSGIETPTIDRLASEGRILEKYYVQPTCAPTRVTIMTGRHTTSHGIQASFDNDKPIAVSFEDTLLPEAFTAAGYVSHAVGRWGLGFFRWEATPTFRGFASFYGYYGWEENDMSHGYKGAYDFRRDDGPMCGEECSIVERKKGKYATGLFTKRAIKLIAAHDVQRPLFLYLAWQAVHAPGSDYCPHSLERLYNHTPRDKKFACSLTLADEGLGKIVDALQTKRMLKDSVIIFSSDNGGPVSTNIKKFDDIGASNWPLRGGKNTLFEGGVRAAGLIWTGWWGSVEQHSIHPLYDHLMGSVDWFPTLLEAAGITSSDLQQRLEGVSHWKALMSGISESSPPRKHLLIASTRSWFKSKDLSFALREKDWKLIVGKACPPTSAFGWSGPHGSRLIDDPFPDVLKNTTLLFDLRNDPEEKKDLSAKHPKVVKHMMELLQPFLERAGLTSTKLLSSPDRKILNGAPIDHVWQPWTVSAPRPLVTDIDESLLQDNHRDNAERSQTSFGALVVSPADGLLVRNKKELRTGDDLGRIEVGTRVVVDKIAHALTGGMIRVRITSPIPGWISIGKGTESLFVKLEVPPISNTDVLGEELA